MNLLFDTSALSKLLTGNDQFIRTVSSPMYTRLLIPLVVDAELRFGYANGNKNSQNITVYENFQVRFGTELIIPDPNTSLVYADLAAWCRKHGISISQNDLWVATTVAQQGGKLLTIDKDFERLPQISLADIAN